MSTLHSLSFRGPYQICYEHAFINPIDHKPGSNVYTYQYPDHWIQYPGSLHAAAVRSVTITPAARDIAFQNIFLQSKIEGSQVDLGLNINFSMSFGEDMNDFNERMKDEIYYLFDNYCAEVEKSSREWRPTDFRIFYRYSKNELIFQVTNDTHYFFCIDDDDKAEYTSDDFKAIVGIDSDQVFINIAQYQSMKIDLETFNQRMKQIPDVDVLFRGDTSQVTNIIFKNVWNRGRLIINSTLSTLAEAHFLTLSNTINPEPKYYEIHGFKTDFSIHLYDACLKNPVELPADGKDLMIVEMILVAR